MKLSDVPKSIRIALVVAAARNGVIGRDGDLPWRMPSDLKAFRRLTLGKPIIMGRKTFQSIGKPLDGRTNIVVTRSSIYRPEGVIVVHDLAEAIEQATAAARTSGACEVMVIGGAEIYAAARALAGRIYLTRIDAEPDGDAWFKAPSASPACSWQLVSKTPLETGPRDDHAAECLVFDRNSVSKRAQ